MVEGGGSHLVGGGTNGGMAGRVALPLTPSCPRFQSHEH